MPDCGFPLAWSVEEGAARTFYTALGHFPGAWERPPTCGIWPEASPGWRGAPNLTSMSGSSSVDSLPEVMAAAVYQSPGVITVEERTLPDPGRTNSSSVCTRVASAGPTSISYATAGASPREPSPATNGAGRLPLSATT